MSVDTDIIEPTTAGTLSGLFRLRVARTPDRCAYRYYSSSERLWRDVTWAEAGQEVARWQAALQREGCQRGDRVAIMLNNCCEWVWFEQAALGLGLVVVPLYVNDRPDNVAYIIGDAGARVLLLRGNEQWRQLDAVRSDLAHLQRIVTLEPVDDNAASNMTHIAAWLTVTPGALAQDPSAPNDLCTIVYTSGTTGRPKGVMLSNHNILWNARSAMRSVVCRGDDVFLSFLPLSHTLERTAGHYLPMMAGATVAYARSIALLAEDLITIKPTVLISVPRIFERIAMKVRNSLAEKGGVTPLLFEAAVHVGWDEFLHQQKRGPWHAAALAWPFLQSVVADKLLGKLGGRVRVAVCGGAPLSAPVARLFLGLGLPLVQGYGMTETSPIVSVNALDDNDPLSVGRPLGDVEVRIGEQQELLVRSPGVMLGYWNNADATRAVIDRDGWLHTGDQARIDHDHIYITGRLKEIIVLANGEKVPPADMEAAILQDPLFDQAMVIGEGKPYLAALVVVNQERWHAYAASLHVADDAALCRDKRAQAHALERIAAQLHEFPGYAQIRNVALQLQPWTVENELLTPTLKLRRSRIIEQFAADIEQLYVGH